MQQVLLGTFQIAVDDFVGVEVVHAGGDLDGPVDGEPRWQKVAVAEVIVQRSIRAVLHHHTVARRLSTRSPET